MDKSAKLLLGICKEIAEVGHVSRHGFDGARFLQDNNDISSRLLQAIEMVEERIAEESITRIRKNLSRAKGRVKRAPSFAMSGTQYIADVQTLLDKLDDLRGVP
jgi:hypothetical protein